jgi:hypothetical protein
MEPRMAVLVRASNNLPETKLQLEEVSIMTYQSCETKIL